MSSQDQDTGVRGGRSWRTPTAVNGGPRGVPDNGSTCRRACLPATDISGTSPSHPGEDIALSPRPWKVWQRRLQQADGPFLTSPGRPSPSKVPRRHGGSPLTTGQVCRKNRSDASSLLPRKLSKNPGTREGRVTQACRRPPLGRRGGEKTGCAPPRCASQQLRQALRAPRRGVGGKTARHKVLESQAMTSS